MKKEDFDAWDHLEDDNHNKTNHKKSNTHTITFLCECFSPTHHMMVFYNKDWDDVYVNIKLNKYPFWKRLLLGIKYIFGFDITNMNMYDEFIFNFDDIPKLENILNHLKEKKIKYERMQK
jgi:hypothetical protein